MVSYEEGIRLAGRLRAKQIGALRPGRHGDGGTLFLVVEPGGRSRHWVQRLTIAGKRRDLGLGGYPYVGLAEARAAAFANRQLARRGEDPTATVRQSRLPTVTSLINFLWGALVGRFRVAIVRRLLQWSPWRSITDGSR